MKSSKLDLLARIRIEWAISRYRYWLDLSFVPRRKRKALGRELRSNLTDAAWTVGAKDALVGVGPIRALAKSVADESGMRSKWAKANVSAATALAGAVLVFLLLTLYYAEGVLDTGSTGEVSSSLFPFFGSRVTIDATTQGFWISGHPGLLPVLAAFATWLLIARPWVRAEL